MDWSQVVEGDPQGVLIGDPDGHLRYLNPSAVLALGAPSAESLIGKPLADLLAGFPASVSSTRTLPTGESVWYLSAQTAADRDAALFAADVGDALAGTLSVRRTLGCIVDLAVPRLGLWATATLWDNDRIRCFGRGPGAIVDDRDIPTRRLDDAGRRRIQDALEADYEEIILHSTSELTELGASEEAAVTLLKDGPVRVVTLSLQAHGSALGTLAVAPAPRIDPAFLEALAKRAAVALSSARVYEERSTLASTLRSVLIPSELPSPPGLRVGSVYRPALETTEIGGDFFEMRHEGRAWGFSIGDVCGKGVEAAVLTGQVRQSLSTVSLITADPAERLRLLNSALLRTDGSSFVTVVHGVASPTPNGITVEMAAGGHPAPLVRRRDGTVEAVPVAGPIIGMLDSVEFRPVSLELIAGETLVCYTDGLSEAKGADGLFGSERLMDVLAECAGTTAQAIAERLLRRALEHLDGRPHDDMAVLAVQVEP